MFENVKLKNAVRSAYTRAWLVSMSAATVLCGVTPVHAEDTPAPTGDPGGLEQYSWWPSDFSETGSSEGNATAVASWGFNLFFALGCLFFGVKMMLAFYNWMVVPTDSHHDGQKKELFSEILEPLKGLCMFIAGALLFKMFLTMFTSTGALPSGSENILDPSVPE